MQETKFQNTTGKQLFNLTIIIIVLQTILSRPGMSNVSIAGRFLVDLIRKLDVKNMQFHL
jgi:hypothetical protein